MFHFPLLISRFLIIMFSKIVPSWFQRESLSLLETFVLSFFQGTFSAPHVLFARSSPAILAPGLARSQSRTRESEPGAWLRGRSVDLISFCFRFFLRTFCFSG